MAAQEWAPIIQALTAGESLDYGQSYWLMDQVMSGELGEARLASFLTAMAIKGATVDEIHGLADGMQDHAAHVDLPSRALDIVGTGGDGYKTVNISTMSAIVLAAMGIPLVKHGNRAATSKSGSADVIEALGVNLDLDADALRRIFDEVGIAFLFANKMHPSMRFAAPVRRALGFPTAFNVLGPLTNPARVQACAIGASREENARLMAGVYASRGLSALVFRGANTGLDELTTTDANQVWIVSGGSVTPTEFDARESLGMASSSIEDLAGGEAAENAAVARDVLSGGGADAVRDAVALNVGAGILAWEGLENPVTQADFAERMRSAVERALGALADGSGARLIERWVAASNEQGQARVRCAGGDADGRLRGPGARVAARRIAGWPSAGPRGEVRSTRRGAFPRGPARRTEALFLPTTRSLLRRRRSRWVSWTSERRSTGTGRRAGER